MLVDLKQKSQVTIPKTLVDKLKLKVGDKLDIEEKNGKLVVTPVVIVPKDQEWYWTKEWQEKERKAEEDLKAGRVHTADTAEELIEHLESD